MKGLAGALVLAVVAAASAGPVEPVGSAPEAIVVASDDPAFRAALHDTLVPAGITVLAAEPTAPPSLGDLAAASRELADRAHATATVWLLGTTLVTYDRAVDRVLVRALPFTAPLTTAQSAEAARMARTMLRALRVTPDSDLPPPHATDAPATHASAARPPRAAPMLAASLGVGLRARGPTDDVALDGTAAVIWRPDALGAAVAGSFAPATDVMTTAFTGSIRDESIAAVARLPIRAGRFGAAASAGAALHAITLRGTLATGAVSSTSLDPAVRIGVAGGYAVDPTVDIGVAVSADYLLRSQRYEAGSVEILEVSRLAVTAGVILTMRVL